MNTAERARRRLLIFALLVAAAFVVLALSSWWLGRDNPRAGSKVLSQGGPALKITRIPTSYRAVFRIDNRGGEKIVTTTERTWFRRPFQSRIETWSGPPPGATRLSIRQTAFGVLASTSRNAEPLNIAAPPSIASGDVRVDVVLRDAVRARTIVRRERREVFGRECQVYRAGGPVFAGDLSRYEPGRGDYADFCVDRTGLVAEEAWFLKGSLVQRRAAVEVEVDPAIDRETFEIDVQPSEGLLEGKVERLGPINNDVEGLWGLPRAPKGFDALGRYGVVIPSAALPRTGGQPPGPGPSSTTDVYVRGPDLLVVDQDPSLASIIRRESRPSRRVEIAGLKDAELITDARMSEVRGIAADGSIVRIFGTLSPSELLKLARQLKPTE